MIVGIEIGRNLQTVLLVGLAVVCVVEWWRFRRGVR